MGWKSSSAFYEETWAEEVRTGKGLRKPDPEVVYTTRHLNEESTALELGCGLGRNGLFLAEHIAHVTLVDRSVAATEYLEELRLIQGLPISVIRGDVLHVPLEQYNAVIASFLLDEFTEANAKWLVRRMQDATLPGGYNVIVVCGRGTKRKQRFPFKNHFFCESELIRLYPPQVWAIRQKQTFIEKMVDNNPVIRLIAQRNA